MFPEFELIGVVGFGIRILLDLARQGRPVLVLGEVWMRGPDLDETVDCAIDARFLGPGPDIFSTPLE